MKHSPTRGAKAHRGFTLMEALIALGVLAILSGALGMALTVGLEMVATTRAHGEAARDASMSMAIALRDLEDGALVTVAEPELCRYRKPLLDDQGFYILDPEGENSGGFATVARGPEMEISYDWIYNELYLDDLEDYDPKLRVADGIEELHFLYDGVEAEAVPSPSSVRSVTVILRTSGEATPWTVGTEVRKTARLRNHM